MSDSNLAAAASPAYWGCAPSCVLTERIADGVVVASVHVWIGTHADTLYLTDRGYRFPHWRGRFTDEGHIIETGREVGQ